MRRLRARAALALVPLSLACGEGGDEQTPPPVFDPPLGGVNLAGAEFSLEADSESRSAGVHGQNYIYPDPAYASGYDSAEYFLGRGMRLFRLPFRWERLQPELGAALDADELERLTTTVQNLTDRGAHVILDVHNYARYWTALIGSSELEESAFADLWTRLASEFRDDPLVVFGLMNEPHDMPSEQWASAANAAIAAIRAAGAENLILVPGNGWSGAHSWSSGGYGTPNAIALLDVTDPLDHLVFEAHQYFDGNSSGFSDTCVSETIGAERLEDFSAWLETHGKRGFLGEFGAGASETCLAATDGFLAHIHARPELYWGWTWWAAGPWWGDYPFSLEPTASGDAPQMAVLEGHLPIE